MYTVLYNGLTCSSCSLRPFYSEPDEYVVKMASLFGFKVMVLRLFRESCRKPWSNPRFSSLYRPVAERLQMTV